MWATEGTGERVGVEAQRAEDKGGCKRTAPLTAVARVRSEVPDC